MTAYLLQSVSDLEASAIWAIQASNAYTTSEQLKVELLYRLGGFRAAPALAVPNESRMPAFPVGRSIP